MSNKVLTDRVHAILQTQTGSIDDETVKDVIQDCFRHDSTGENLFLLIDRLVQEKARSVAQFPRESSPTTDLKKLVNSAVFQWKNTYTDSSEGRMVATKPSDVLQKIRKWAAQSDLVVDTAIYTMILEASGSIARDHEHGVEFAESLLQWMFQQAHEHKNYLVQPTTVTVAVVMKAWVASGRPEAPQRIEAWLDQLHAAHDEGWLNVQPNTICYNILLHALAENKQSEQTEELIQQMLRNDHLPNPDPVSFTTVLLAYCREETADAMAKAEVLLDQMLELHGSGRPFAKPNIFSFTIVMNGYAQLGDGETAHRLLQKVQALYDESYDPDWEPDVTTYNTVMVAWARAERPDLADKLLQEVLNESLVDVNEYSFHAVLTGWARVGDPEQAEALLLQMHQLHASGAHENPPNVMTYNIVLDSWAKSRRKDAWKRSLDILRHMEDVARSEPHVKPNSRTWNTVLNCFRYCGQGDFHHAFNLLEDFCTASREGRVDGEPDVRTFNTVLAACANNTKDDFRLLQILKSMKESDILPDIVTYNTIIKCYARYAKVQGDARDGFERCLASMKNESSLNYTRATYLALVDAWIAFGEIDEAECVLKDMCAAAAASLEAMTDREPFHRVLVAWSNKKQARRVESIVLLMEELHQRARLATVKPVVETYNILLHAWSRSNERQAGERADLVFREMNIRGMSPNLTSYNSVINAWANSGDPISSTKIESLVLEMILSGHPDLIPDQVTYNTWMKSILKDSNAQQERRIKELVKTMKIHDHSPSDYIQKIICSLQRDKFAAT